MANQQGSFLTAIDVGSAKTCALVAEVTESGLRYRGHGIADSRGSRKGVIVELDKAVSSIQKAVEAAEDMAGAAVEHAIIGVGGSNIKGVNSHGGISLGTRPREIGRDEIKQAVERARAIPLPQDRENAQKYMKGAKDSIKADGCDLVQVLETHGLTVNEAVSQANDILTAHPDVKAIYGMYDEAATGAAKALQTRGMTGKVAVVTADGSPTTIRLLRDGSIQGIFLQEAVGQGIDATTQVFNALNHKPTTQELALKEPLVTKDTIDHPDAQATVKRVYPPSAGNY